MWLSFSLSNLNQSHLFLSHVLGDVAMTILTIIMLLLIAVAVVMAISYYKVNHYCVFFSANCCITPCDGYIYCLCEDICVIANDVEMRIPKGFKTDLATIPRILWPIIAPQFTNIVRPAILHDYMYAHGVASNRKFADDVLYSCLRAHKVSLFISLSFWLGVRLFGYFHYKGIRNGQVYRDFDRP